MRRKIQSQEQARGKALVYLFALIGIGVYAIPHLPRLQPGLAGTFSMLWILLLGLAIAANLYFVFGADVERKRMLEEQAVIGLPSHKEDLSAQHLRSRLRG